MLKTTNSTLFPNETDSYIGRVYVQDNYLPNGTTTYTYFNATPCQNIIPQDDYRYSVLHNYYCPDVNDEHKFTIQGTVGSLPFNNTNQQSLKLLIGYCEDM